MLNDITKHRTLSYSLEMGSQDLQRHCTQLESDVNYLKGQLRDAQREADILRKQIEMERDKYNELERLMV